MLNRLVLEGEGFLAVVFSFVAAEDGLLPGGEFFFEAFQFFRGECWGEVFGFHGIFVEIVEFPGDFVVFVYGVDFVGPVEEGGVAFFVGSVGVGGEVVDVFEEASRERSLLARLLGFHELLDDAVVPG